MLGVYANFPLNIHRIDYFEASVPSRKLQQKLLEVLCDVNKKEFNFADITIPTVPNSQVIFEFGLAEDNSFTFIDEEETKKALEAIKNANLQTIDLFCSIRYYKKSNEKNSPLKFDYYFVRIAFAAGKMELQISHERGPRYISPEDLSSLIANKVNFASLKKVLRRTEPSG
jgi:hypothetical protein